VRTVMNIIGDVNGPTCVIMDDMVDTANTLCAAADALKEQGAVRVVAYCTHAVLSGPAVSRIEKSVIDELVGDGHHPAQARRPRRARRSAW
jgi:ribose-phosphate pyrophosphokinase